MSGRRLGSGRRRSTPAAAFPAVIPAVLDGLSGIAASEATYAVESDCNKVALFGKGMVAGTVETMLERTLYAAVAAAASFDALGSKRVRRRYGRCLGSI